METIGQYIYELRIQKGLTQDQFGKLYQISGPAVFKFEKGFVKPSLELWLSIAKDVPLSDKVAVLLWIRDRLPENFQDVIQIVRDEKEGVKKVEEKPADYIPNYGKITDSAELRKKLQKDKKIPEGLKKLSGDDELWVIYKPTGKEIDFVITHFGQFKNAGKEQFREAIRLYRNFASTK